MNSGFQLAAVHGTLYTGGNVVFSRDGTTLYSPVNNYLSAIALQREGHESLPCSNSTISCFDLSPDGDLALVVGQGRGLGFFYSIPARAVLDTISFPPQCTLSCVRFSPCGRYVALALEATLQVYTAPARRVVGYHGCHRVENLHQVLSLPIQHMEWTADSEHLLVCGQDARMRIVPRQGKPHLKGLAMQTNALVGHRAAVLGAWFTDAAAADRVVSVSADNVVMVWRRTRVTRREVLQAIATANLRARTAGSKKKKNRKNNKKGKKHSGEHDNEEEEEEEEFEEEESDEESEEEETEDGERIPKSFLERQRLETLKLEGVRVSTADDTYLPDVLRLAFEVECKFMLTHQGNVTVCAYHRPRGLLALGYSSGVFAIHTLPEAPPERGAAATAAAAAGTKVPTPELPLVHLLSISAQALTAAQFSPSGDYVAFGSAHLRQLLVWDWRAEAYVLKEQAHYYDIARAAITADGAHILSGGEDGKVKVWSAASGQCVVTFTEHTAPVTGLSASAATNAFFTCSLDGTARAYDLVRYRQFRIFTAPENQAVSSGATAAGAVQFSCVAVDPSGEVLALGTRSLTKVFLFSVQTGRVVDMLDGHEGPVATLAFHPSGTALVSGALDHHLILWDLFNQNDGGERLKGDGEVVDVGSEVLCVAYSHSGRYMAILTAAQAISVYETSVATEPVLVRTFQTSFDAAGGWSKEVGPRSANAATHFTRIAFSPDGERVVAAGDAKWIVMYHATQGFVLHKWPVTTNMDAVGAEEQFAWRGASEAGFVDDIDVSDADPHLARRGLLEMPGSRHRHFATGKRATALTARTMDVAFSPAGTEFVAATTDGLLLFSSRRARPRFRPLQLRADLTTAAAARLLAEGRHVQALAAALELGDATLGVECLRRTPRAAIAVAAAAAPTAALPLLIQWVGAELEAAGARVEQAALWAQALLLYAGADGSRTGAGGRPLVAGAGGVNDSANNAAISGAGGGAAVTAALKGLERSLHAHTDLAQLASENCFTLRYLSDMARLNTQDVLRPMETREETAAAAAGEEGEEREKEKQKREGEETTTKDGGETAEADAAGATPSKKQSGKAKRKAGKRASSGGAANA